MKLDRIKLQFLMAEKEMNASDLAKKGNISISSLCKYIKGTLNPSIKQIGKIANALEIDVKELMIIKKEQTQ